jgi:hypothetical protein
VRSWLEKKAHPEVSKGTTTSTTAPIIALGEELRKECTATGAASLHPALSLVGICERQVRVRISLHSFTLKNALMRQAVETEDEREDEGEEDEAAKAKRLEAEQAEAR